MKINRTFTMDLSTIEMLKGKSNKSLIVNLAVRQYMNHEHQFQLGDVITKKLLLVLQQRTELSPQLLALINLELLHGFE